VKGYFEIHDALRTDPNLAHVRGALYNDALDAALHGVSPAPTAEAAAAEVHMVCRLLQVMETVWLELDLEQFEGHTLNTGWLVVLKRWTRSPIVQRQWPVLKNEFSEGFQHFFERVKNS
jgi:hypothetical protein